MRTLDRRLFKVCWLGFAVFFLVLQVILNRTVNGLTVLASVLAAVPVATIIGFREQDRPEG